MAQYRQKLWMSSFMFLILLSLLGCKGEQKEAADSKELPDLNAQMRPYMTIDNTKLRSGPGLQFRAIAEIRRDAKIQVVGRDGDCAGCFQERQPPWLHRNGIDRT